MVITALILNGINYLDNSVEWLNGLLENYGLSPALAGQYYKAFLLAVEEQQGFQAGPVLECLARFKKNILFEH